MLKRLSTLMLTAAALLFCSTNVTADPEPEYQHPDTDWLTWTVKDTKGDTIDLSAYENQATYVLVFSSSDKDAAKMMSAAATYIREHPNKASKIVGMCSDDTGHKALKLHIRQEEWTKRTKAWEAEQEEAEAEAIAAEEEFEPEEMPDFLQEILDEIDDPEDLQDLMDHHYPCHLQPVRPTCRPSRWRRQRQPLPVLRSQ